MCGLRILAGPTIYHLPGDVISATVGFVNIILLSIITCSPNKSFLARLVSDNSGSLEKFELGASSSRTTPKVYALGPELLFVATCASDLTFLALLTS